MIFVLSVIAVFLSCYFFYLFLTRNFDYWKRRNVKGPKPVPIFGNIQDIAMSRLTAGEFSQHIYREFTKEKYVGIFQLSTPTIMLRDPQMIKQFLVKDFQYFEDRGFSYDDQKEPLTANLVNLKGVKWKLLRQKLTPSFSSAKIKNMMILLQECSKQLLNYLEDTMRGSETRDVEIREFMAKFTTDVIGSCAFGLQFHSMTEASSDFRVMGKRVTEPSKMASLSRMLRCFFPPLYHVLKLRTFPKEVNDFFISVVTDTLRHRQLNNIHREDFLDALSEIRGTRLTNSDGDRKEEINVTDSVIAAQAFAFFTAGFETSSTTLSFCLHELALHKSIQNQVFLEVDAIASNNGKPFNYESIKDMVLLEQCLLETMRKYPPVQCLSRICTKSYALPGTNIVLDRGTAVQIPVYAIHHDEKYYENPSRFDPHRFAKENINERESGTYLPFGDGPRVCIGMRFAMLEMKLALATLIHKFEVRPCSKTNDPLLLDPCTFLLAPKDGIWLKIIDRNTIKPFHISRRNQTSAVVC